MSLKAFHIFFITASSALTFGCGLWLLKDYFSAEGTKMELVLGLGSLLAAIALIVYGRYFLKKLKHVSYL